MILYDKRSRKNCRKVEEERFFEYKKVFLLTNVKEGKSKKI